MANNQQLLLVDVDRETGALRVAPAAEAGRVLSQIPLEESVWENEPSTRPSLRPIRRRLARTRFRLAI